jgi:uracil-DNA glycosylase
MAEDLAKLLADIRACRICRDAPLFPPALAHEPRPVLRAKTTARIWVAGQAPGTRVHASGVPFSDPSGVRLRQWMGVTDEEFYDEARVAIAPMGFCFPGQDRNGGDLPPRRECALTWHDRLFAALPKVELVLAIGGYAHAYHLKGAQKKTRDRARLAGILPAGSRAAGAAAAASVLAQHGVACPQSVV